MHRRFVFGEQKMQFNSNIQNMVYVGAMGRCILF